jgi:hypothetical protein
LEANQNPNVWVPVCCERVMRFNIFAPQGRPAYGVLVCSVCHKNVAFELEHQPDISKYGNGSRVLSMLGSPMPPTVERKKPDGHAAPNEETL